MALITYHITSQEIGVVCIVKNLLAKFKCLCILILDFPCWAINPLDSFIMNKSNAFRQGLSIAFRLGTELTVAVMIGAAIGFALDRYLSTKPWLLAVGVVIGGAAGCLNVYRISKEINIDEDTDPNNDS